MPFNGDNKDMTGELTQEQLVETAVHEFEKFLTAIRKRDIAMGNEAIKSMKIILDAAANEINVENILYKGSIEYANKSFCFTGKFEYGERKACEATVIAKGGTVSKNVNLKLDYLIVGSDFSSDWAHQNYGRKIERALEIQKTEGATRPFIIHETDWVKSL